MGLSKAMLPFGAETMLVRTVRLLLQATDTVCVVAASGQELPQLPASVRIVRDERQGNGPLEGLRVGLSALRGESAAAFVTGCDTPLLIPAFVTRAFELLGENDVAVPRIDGLYHPLAAVYSTSVVPKIEALLAAGRMRPVYLYESVPPRELTAAELSAVDPDLSTLVNLNRPEDYLAALATAGFSPDPAILRALAQSEEPHDRA